MSLRNACGRGVFQVGGRITPMMRECRDTPTLIRQSRLIAAALTGAAD